ncbi:hypothetical protein BC832DRAFT_523578, partial [Gaertneriomyces semiglobifer]
AKLDDDEEDIETILKQFAEEEKQKQKVTEEILQEPPSARANGAICVVASPQPSLFLFGGECLKGNKLYVYNDLFKYRIDKKEWRKISSPNSPGPRSGHQMVALNNGKLVLFGGEYASPSQNQFYHWKDCWVFDLKESKWDKLDIPTPPARSGHRMAVWKNYIVLFGGFYDNYKTTKYYDDLWLFDTHDYKWNKVDLINGPSSRSGFQFLTYNDDCFLYGGYCKKTGTGDKDQGIVHKDMWCLHMASDPTLFRWERIKRSGTYPPARAGCSLAVHKNRAILFGGVEDDEEGEDCVCQNDLYGFNFDTKKWFLLTIKKTIGQSEPNDAISADQPEDSKFDPSIPHPRYNAMIAVHKNLLLLYGGIFEGKKEEFTLDDMWSLNVDKQGPWERLQHGSWERDKASQPLADIDDSDGDDSNASGSDSESD